MRNREVIDSELRLLAAARRSIREHGGEPSSSHIDARLDERLRRFIEHEAFRICLRLPGTTTVRSWLATLDRSAVGGPAPLGGAIGRVCEVHHGCALSERNVFWVQVGVDLLGNLVIRPTPPEIVADEVRHPDDALVVAGRPSEAKAAQLIEVRVINGIGSRNRSGSNQGSANHHGDGESS
jgi:hypothetical protein